MRPGDCAAFPKNDGNGHCLINRSQRDALYLEIGTRKVHDRVVYPDIDLLNINLENRDLSEAKRRILLLAEAFRKDGTRITENLDFEPPGSHPPG